MRRRFTIAQLSRELGVKLRFVFKENMHPLGDSPFSVTTLCIQNGSPVILCHPSRNTENPSILHELCHLICGPESLNSEEILVPVQWKLIQRLTPHSRRKCEEEFKRSFYLGTAPKSSVMRFLVAEKRRRLSASMRDYNLKLSAFRGSLFTQTTKWREYETEARERGLLTASNNLRWSNLKVDSRAWEEELNRTV